MNAAREQMCFIDSCCRKLCQLLSEKHNNHFFTNLRHTLTKRFYLPWCRSSWNHIKCSRSSKTITLVVTASMKQFNYVIFKFYDLAFCYFFTIICCLGGHGHTVGKLWNDSSLKQYSGFFFSLINNSMLQLVFPQLNWIWKFMNLNNTNTDNLCHQKKTAVSDNLNIALC